MTVPSSPRSTTKGRPMPANDPRPGETWQLKGATIPLTICCRAHDDAGMRRVCYYAEGCGGRWVVALHDFLREHEFVSGASND